MSRLQFLALLSPSVGTFVLVILAWMHSNLRLNDLRESTNTRFGDVDRQFGAARADVNRQFSDLRAETNRQFGEMRADTNRQFGELRADMNRQFDETNRRLGLIESDQKQFYAVTGKLDGRIDEISRK